MSTIGQRVRASIPAGMRQQELAACVGMTTDALSRALNGQRHFSALELAEIARVLDQDFTWLVTGEPDRFRLRLAARHAWGEAEAHSTDGDLAILERVREAYASAYGDAAPAQAATLPAAGDAARASIVDFDVRYLAEQIEDAFAVDVVRHPGLKTDYSVAVGGRRVIVLRSTTWWFRANWSLAHELGHLALGHHAEAPERRYEGPADQFAADFLLPAEMMRATKWEAMTEGDLAVWLWDAGVSTVALRRRLRDLDLVTAADSALRDGTEKLLRRHVDRLPRDRFGDPIIAREGRATGIWFPQDLIGRLTVRVAAGDADPRVLAWVRDVDVDDVWWPEDDAPPRPERSAEEWFALAEGL